MRWHNVKLILQREVRDQLRDRRTLFMIAVLPLLLYPLLGMSFLQISQFMQEQPTAVLLLGDYDLPGLPPLVQGNQFAPNLFHDPSKAALLELHFNHADGDESHAPADDAKAEREGQKAVQQGTYEVAIYFPQDFRTRLERFRLKLVEHRQKSDEPAPEVPSPIIFYNQAKDKSQFAYSRVAIILERWTELIGQQNLKDSQVPAQTARPFSLDPHDVAEGGGANVALLSKILPFILLLWALTGAFYPAVDLCAGEKERGTLETLLSSPAERLEIVCGKLGTVMLFSIATAVLNLINMGVTGALFMRHYPELSLPSPLAVLWLLLALVPVSALFSALCLALAAFARSTKEGQYYLMPLVLLILPLTVLPMAPGVELTLGNSLIPITGVVLLLRSLLEGAYWEALPYVPVVVAITLLCMYWAIRWAADQFNSESVLFRESERFDLGLWLKQLYRERQDTPTVGQAMLCGLVILMIRFFMNLAMPTEGVDLTVQIAVGLLVVVATPALLMTIMLARNPAKTLLLRVPTLASVPAALLLAVAIHPLADLARQVVNRVYPMSRPMRTALENLAKSSEGHSLWVLLLTVALLPAICEELAFRGFILSGLRHLGHKWRAIVISSLFFGVSHAIFQQSIIACFLGMVIGYLAVQSGSLWPGVFFHLTHNSLTILRSQLPESWADDPLARWFLIFEEGHGFTFTWLTIGISAVLTAGLLAWFHRLPYARSSEESLQETIEKVSHGRSEMALPQA